MTSKYTFGYISKRMENWDSKKYLYTHVYSSIIHSNKLWKQPKSQIKHELMNEIWHILTIGYYSALKRKKILISITA